MSGIPRGAAVRALLAGLCLAGWSSCGTTERDQDPLDPPVGQRRVVGRIASVIEPKGFVLIQRLGSGKFTPGTTLTTEGDGGRSANLLVTGEQQGQYGAADIRSGTARVGDAVFLPPPVVSEPDLAPVIVAPAAPSAPVPEATLDPASDPDQMPGILGDF